MVEIPWERFDEDDLQTIISTLYEHSGVDVYNVHKIQRSEEKGADLILSYKGKRLIAMGVKIKPEKKDAYQLIELWRRKEKIKIYVFIDEPTPQFKEEMERCKGKVRFWNKKKLTSTFFEYDPYFASSLLLDNTPFSLTTAKIRDFFVTVYSDRMKGSSKSEGISKTSLKMLWRLKDNSAVLHKMNLFLMQTFENLDKSKFKEEAVYALLEGYVHLLELMDDAAKHFDSVLMEFSNKNLNFLKYVMRETTTKSNWPHIASFKIFSPKQVRHIIAAEKESEKQLTALNKKVPKVPPEMVKNPSAILSSIEDNLKNFYKFWWGVEETIDDFFNYALKTSD